MVEAANKRLANLSVKDAPNRKSIRIDRIKKTPFKRSAQIDVLLLSGHCSIEK